MQVWELRTRKYLEEARKKELLVSDLLAEQERLEQKAYSVGTSQAGIKTKNPPRDRMADNLIRIDEQRKKLTTAINECTDFRLLVTEQIHRLSNEKEKKILYQHYLENKTFWNIAKEMDVGYDYVTRIHRKGIQSFWIKNERSISEYLRE